MLFGFISFSGRLSRFGWIISVAFQVIAVLGGLYIVDELSWSLRGLSYELQENIVIGMIALAGLAALSFLGASVRRLRDGGSKRPFMEMIIAMVIPGLGWLYLAAKLLFVGSKFKVEENYSHNDAREMRSSARSSIEREAVISGIVDIAEEVIRRKGQSSAQQSSHSSRSEEFRSQVADTTRRRLEDASSRHHIHGESSGGVVTRIPRKLGTRSRKVVGF